MKTTQRDIAKRIGVSTSLVSRVLSGQAHKIGVHPKKIEEILRVAKEMNYVPSPAALILKGKKSRTVGIVAYDFSDPYFSFLIGELQELSHLHNYSLLLVGFQNRKPCESDLLPLYKHSVDGIIILGSFGDLSWTDAFRDIPIARIGHGSHPNLALSISVDESDAMRKILAHLVKDLGLRRIAFATRGISAYDLRSAAAAEVGRAFGVEVEILLPKEDDGDFKVGGKIALDLLKRGAGSLPEAVVCATDTIAMGLVKKFHEAGVRVPEDVAITGFDDIPSAANYIPSITSFRQPVKLFSKECFAAVMESSSPRVVLSEGELIIRKSAMKI